MGPVRAGILGLGDYLAEDEDAASRRRRLGPGQSPAGAPL